MVIQLLVFAINSVEFHNMAKSALTTLAEHILKSLKEAMEKFFTKDWYEGKLMEEIIATVEDYFGDIEGHIMDSHFKKLVNLEIEIYLHY